MAENRRTLYVSLPMEPEVMDYYQMRQVDIEEKSESGRFMKRIRASCDTLERLIVCKAS